MRCQGVEVVAERSRARRGIGDGLQTGISHDESSWRRTSWARYPNRSVPVRRGSDRFSWSEPNGALELFRDTGEPPASTRTRQLAARAEMNTSAWLRDHRRCCVERDRLGLAVPMRRRSRRVPSPPSGFAGFRFPPDVILVAVRYLRYGVSYRDGRLKGLSVESPR